MTDSQIEKEINDFISHCGLNINLNLVDPIVNLLKNKYENVDEEKVRSLASKIVLAKEQEE
ncbi:MAG: hypothetical protein ACNI25_01830 [Halarcobacter sp.]